MRTNLFRFIAADRVEWLAPDAAPRQGTLAELATTAGGAPLLLAAPGELVALTQAKLPGRNRAARLKAIPFALEDNLAEDVEELHFAAGDLLADPTPVAVTRHTVIRGWLEACAQAGVNVQAIIPEPLLLPYEDHTWSLLLDGDRAVVRCGRWEGFVTDQDELELLLNLALTEAGEQPPHYLQVWGGEELELTGLGVEVRRNDAPAAPLAVLAAGYNPATVIDLLQGPYGRRAQWDKWLRPWRLAAALAGAWLLLQGALQIDEYRQLKREQAQLTAAMERVYKEAAPDAQKVVNPRVQLESRLRELRGAGAAGAGFLELLYRGGQALQTLPGVTLRSVRYKENQLDFDMEGVSLEVFDQLKQRLGEVAGLETQVRTTKREDKVESQIILKKAAS